MSRSTRKPYVKDSQGKETKRIASRKVRLTKDVSEGMGYKRIFDSYDLCDFKWKVERPRPVQGYPSKEELKTWNKARRK